MAGGVISLLAGRGAARQQIDVKPPGEASRLRAEGVHFIVVHLNEHVIARAHKNVVGINLVIRTPVAVHVEIND